MFKSLRIYLRTLLIRNYSTKLGIDPHIEQQFLSKEFKPRRHPGLIKLKVMCLPSDLRNAILIVLNDTGSKSFYQESIKLNNYLRSRLPPPENQEINEKAKEIFQNVSVKREDLKSGEEILRKMEVKTFNLLKKNVYRWGSVLYDEPSSLQYLMIRAAPEYAVLCRIFGEILNRIPDYKPKSFFDFGSGVGTGTWAVNNFWKDQIYEYFLVDTSSQMHDLARLILCGGRENAKLNLKGYFQRQFLPASTELKYNIVLSAYSLFELPDAKTRLETIQKLWNKTEDFLIIVEQGTNAGFKLVNEAREFILNITKKGKEGYVFAPCPNDSVCPRYLENKTPCNYLMKYETLPFPNKQEILGELFSYVVLRKGKRPPDDNQWPRVVRAPIVRSGHTICRLCTAQGELKEVIFSKSKFDQTTYRCARSISWGDLLPVQNVNPKGNEN